MEDLSPNFCKVLKTKNHKNFNFTKVCDTGIKHLQYSCSNLNTLTMEPQKQRIKNKKEKSKNKRSFSQKCLLQEYKDIQGINNTNIKKRHKRHKQERINNIHEFIQKHKFRLRNDFDRKHSKKFLLSKEEAFENPSCLLNHGIIIEPKKTFTLK